MGHLCAMIEWVTLLTEMAAKRAAWQPRGPSLRQHGATRGQPNKTKGARNYQAIIKNITTNEKKPKVKSVTNMCKVWSV